MFYRHRASLIVSIRPPVHPQPKSSASTLRLERSQNTTHHSELQYFKTLHCPDIGAIETAQLHAPTNRFSPDSAGNGDDVRCNAPGPEQLSHIYCLRVTSADPAASLDKPKAIPQRVPSRNGLVEWSQTPDSSVGRAKARRLHRELVLRGVL